MDNTDSPLKSEVPRHVAVVMDGNGRWAESRGLPRQAGHQAGVKTARLVVEECVRHGIQVLTLFAFSSENWKRPRKETSFLMDLFFRTLRQEAHSLADEGVALRVIGERADLPPPLVNLIEETETIAADARRMVLQIALSYGGRWDVARAARRLGEKVAEGRLDPAAIDEQAVAAELSFSDLPDVDFFVRTGGELRMSNFVLWQAAYAEFYFTERLWPDFDAGAFQTALDAFARRQRRFGRTGAQVRRDPP
ncbi:MAG: polyprenyl diphosphate synthase [Pseudomonadota bacterium]